MGPSGFVAVLAGWITTEVGRQPYTDLRSPAHRRLRLAASRLPRRCRLRCIAFIVVYFIVFGAGIVYILRLMAARARHRRARHRERHADARRRHHARCRRSPTRRDGKHGGLLHAFDLAFIWAGLIAFAVLAYVLFDGFDLGIGILFPCFATETERDEAMNSVAPVWDGNETWLVLGGGGLMAAFPLAYAVVLPALYAPLIAMLLALDLPRRRLRIPLSQRPAQAALGLGVRRRLDRCRLRPGRGARRAGAGHSRLRARLRRRLVGLAVARSA